MKKIGITIQIVFLLKGIIGLTQNQYPVNFTINDTIRLGTDISFRIPVTFNTEPSWYIYAPTGNNAAQGMLETNVMFSLPEGFTKVGKLQIPKPQFKSGHEIYEGDSIVLSQQFKLEDTLDLGNYTINAKISYQTCNDKICLPPVTETVPIVVVVKGNANEQKTGGIQFDEKGLNSALSKAKTENKLVFVDAYTVWCGPCIKMDREVFPMEEVGSYFNAQFINLKLDMEKGEGLDFAKEYKVDAYPTFLFLDGEGREVHRFTGSKNADEFIQLAKEALNPESQYRTQLELYNNGKKDPDFLYDLVYMAKKAGDGAVADTLLHTYLRTKSNYLEPKNAKLIFDNTNSVEDEQFPFMMTHKESFQKIVGRETFDKRMGTLVFNEALKSYPLNQKEHVKEDISNASSLFKTILPEQSEELSHRYALTAYVTYQDGDGYATEMIDYLDKNPMNDANELNSLAWNFYENFDNPEYLNKALEWALQSVNLSEGYANTDTVAAIYAKLGKKNKAKKFARKAIQLGQAEGRDTTSTQRLLEEINQGRS